MRTFIARTLASAAALTAFAAAVPAFAADEPKPALTVSGSVALVSDYRFRGVSQSNNGLAVQGGCCRQRAADGGQGSYRTAAFVFKRCGHGSLKKL